MKTIKDSGGAKDDWELLVVLLNNNTSLKTKVMSRLQSILKKAQVGKKHPPQKTSSDPKTTPK